MLLLAHLNGTRGNMTEEHNETEERIEELKSLLDAKTRLLDEAKEEKKFQVEKLKAYLKKEISLEDEMKDVEEKISKLEEQRVEEILE